MTSLTVGSAAIISYQEDSEVVWSIVLLEDIEAGTEFSFTDNGWLAAGGFRVGESSGVTFTAGQALTAGTVITFTNTSAVLAGTETSVGTMTGDPIDLSVGGSNGEDQIFMYQGTFNTTTGETDPGFQFITGYHARTSWNADAINNETSALPTELTNYSINQSGLGQNDNAVYVGPTGGTQAQLWEEFQDPGNWVGGGNPEADPYLSGFNALSDFTVVGTDPYIFTPDSPLFEANSTGNVITGIYIADADSDRVSVTLTVEGTITLAQTTDLNFITGDGVDDSTVTFSGLIEDVNAALDGLLYTPATDDIDGDTLQIIVSDGTAVIAPGAFPASVDLSELDGTDGFSIDGLAQNDRLGYDVSYAGDINGDGIDDIIIGAPYADDGVLIDHDSNPETPDIQKNYGEAYVIYGTDAGFSSTIDLTALDGSNGFRITNLNGYQGDELGHAVSNLGDINGDGINDFAVGSFNANKDDGMGGTTNDVGKTWVIFGTGSAMPATFDVSTIDGSNGFVVQGDRADDYSGRVITAGGDINGDGIDDFIIAADRTDTPGDKAGGVYVIYGTDEGFDATIDLADIETGDGSVGTYIYGAAAGDRAGRDMHSAGDINGDGLDDIIIGAYQSSFDADGNEIVDHYAGKAFVVFGQEGGLGGTMSLGSLNGSNGFSMDGLAAEDITGRGVSTAGDINGDGIDDIMIGAPLADANGRNSGAVYVVYGTTEGFAADIDLSALDGTDGFTIVGNADGWIGYDLANLGDINGDGIDDILVGSTSSLPSGTHDIPPEGNAGNLDGAYVVFGTDEGFDATFDLGDIDGTNGFQLGDVMPGDSTGFAVSTAGDLNHDGIADMIISASGADPNGSNSGRVYVVFGNANISNSYISQNLAIQLEAPPVIADMDGDTATFTEGDAFTLLDTGTAVSITDAESTDFDGGVLDIQYASGQESEDGLIVDTSGTVALSAGQTAGSEVSISGTVIGTIVSGETGASGEGLQFALNADATPALVQSLLGAIGYTNSAGDTPIAGDRTFTITLDDGDGADTEISTTVSVVAVDTAPVIETTPAAQSFAVNSTDNSITGLSVSDVDSDTVTVTLTVEGTLTLAQTTGLSFDAGADGSSTMTISGSVADVNAAIATLTYTPATDDRDGDTLSVSVTDGTTPLADTVSIALTNTDPVAQDDAVSAEEDGPALMGDVFAENGSGADSDANGDTLTVTEVNGESGDVGSQIALASGALLTLNSDGTFIYDPNGQFEDLDETETTTDSFTYTVDDGFGGTSTATATVTINGANDAPIVTTPEDQSFAVNSSGHTLTGFSVSDVDDGQVTVTLTAEGAMTLADTRGLTFTTGDGTDDTTMTFMGSLTKVNAAISSIGYTSATDDRDGDTIQIDVNDGVDTTTETVAVALTNTDPVANDDAVSVDETGTLTGDVFADNGSSADSDANNDTLTVSHVNTLDSNVDTQITLTSGALLTLNSDGTFAYDPNGAFDTLAAGETDTDTFTYTVSDGFGGSDTATVTLTITGENEAPVAQDDALNVDERDMLAGDVLADNGNGVDSDPNGDTLTITHVNGVEIVSGATITLASGALLTMNDDGTFSYDPNDAFGGLATGETDTDSFTYTISDGLDGTDSATATITINGENEAPVAQDDAATVAESGAVSGDVLADNGNGIDEDANGDTLTVSEVNGVDTNVGTQITLTSGALLTVNANGTFDYDPNGAFDGLAQDERDTDSFNYTIDDGLGGTDIATATITITGENDLPVAQDDAFTLSEDGPALAGDVLADNGSGVDSDPNGDTLTITHVNGVEIVSGATITLASGALLTMNDDGTFEYDPNGVFDSLPDGANGADSFTYTMDDGLGGTDTATANITVTGANDAPQDTVPGSQTFLANSTGNAITGISVSDPDDTQLLVTLSVEGRLTLGQTTGLTFTLGDGTNDSAMAFSGSQAAINAALAGLTYTPANGDRDGDTLSLGAYDGDETTTQTVAITLENAGPVAGDDAYAADDDAATITGNIITGPGADSDANNDTLTVTEVNGQSANVGSIITLASGAELTVNSDGSFTFNLNGAYESLPEGFQAVETITYTVEDGFGGSDTATLDFTINGTQAGDDVGTLTGADEVFYGGVGNDTLDGAGGHDTLYGGDGNDDLTGSAGNDILYGDDGDDFLGGGGGDDEAYGGAGNDTLRGAVGNDRLIGQAGDDLIYGDDGDDFLGGGNGNDLIYGGNGNDTIQGSGGDDRLIGQNGSDTLYGADGNDYIRGSADNDILNGDAGDDELRGDGGDDQLFGGNGNDFLFGGTGNDDLQGADGDDQLYGFVGDDQILGGLGNDFVGAGSGNDLVHGEDGNDEIHGADGNDMLFGDAGDDFIEGNDGDDIVGGGTGNDMLFGDAGADDLQGGEGDDLLGGGSGNDTLQGGDGNDDLRGGGGDDVLAGQAGDDLITGASGVDTFVFAFGEPGSDIVFDFAAGETVQLDGFGYANVGEAAADFSQAGTDVVFVKGNQTVTFKHADLADVVAGIELDGGSTARVGPSGGEAGSGEYFEFTKVMPTSSDNMTDTDLLELGDKPAFHDLDTHYTVFHDGLPVDELAFISQFDVTGDVDGFDF